MKKLLSLILLILILFNTVYADVLVDKDKLLIIDGRNYSKAENGSYTFGTNVWHTRFLRTSMKFPLREIWSQKLSNGQTFGQPAIADNVVIATGGHYIYVLNKEDGAVLNKLQIQFDTSKRGIYSSPFYLFNKDGWFNDDRLDRVFIGTRDGYMYCLVLTQDKRLEVEWRFDSQSNIPGESRYSGIASSPIILFDRYESFLVNGKKAVYISFGTFKGKAYVIDARRGEDITDGIREFSDGTGKVSSSPISYVFPENDTYSYTALGVNEGDNSGSGYLYGGYVREWTLLDGDKLNKIDFNKDVFTEGLSGVPGSIAIAEHEIVKDEGKELDYIFIFSDKDGVIYGYDENEKQIAFIIDKFKDVSSVNSPTVVANNFAVFNFNKNGKAKIVCIDIERALKIVDEKNQQDTEGVKPPPKRKDRVANEAVVWETADNDFAGPSYIGTTAISVKDNNVDADSEYAEYQLLFVGDQGNNKKVPNLRAYYIGSSENGRPVKVQNAFVAKGKDSDTTNWGLNLPGGVKGEIAFIDEGFLVAADGEGALHAFSYDNEKNLAVLNFENNEVPIDKGKRYIAYADVANYSGETAKDVSVEYIIDGSIIRNAKIDKLGPEGKTLVLEYTLPEDFDKDTLNIELRLNMDEDNRTFEETTYEDNIAILEVPVMKELDLAITKIEIFTYYPGHYGPLNIYVKNDSELILKNVPVKITLPGYTDIKYVNLQPNAEMVITSKLKVPNSEMTFSVSAEVNHTRKFKEITYSNNKKTATAKISKYDLPTNCDTYVTWTEFFKEDPGSGTIVKTHKHKKWYYDYDDEGNLLEKWYKWIIDGYDVKFYAKLSLDAYSDITQIKSGYGVTVSFDTSIETNYPKWLRHKIIPIQAVYAYAENGAVLEMVKKSENGLSNSWELPINNSSVLKERRHYIPVEWADGNYKITVRGFNGSTPGGYLYCNEDITINVKGSMYEDDNTN